MFRFIHSADLHLDAPLHSLALKDEVLSDLVGSAARGTLEQIVTLCLEEDVHALLIAGELYDRDLRSMKTAAVLTAQLERLNAAEIPVFIIRGNYDVASVITKEMDLPPNVHVFSGQGGTEQLEEYGVAVHGVSFARPQAPESLLPKYPAPVAGCFIVGLLHTSLARAEGHATYAPCSVSDLNNHGYDYWALGHIHKRQVHPEAPHIVMPGMPQGRDIGEAGTKTVTLDSVSDGPDSSNVTLEERRTSQVESNRLSFALDGVEEWRDMLAQITAAIKEAVSQAAGNCILRVDLTGQTPLAWQVRRDMDLLSEQIRQAAEAIGTVWIEKVECHLRQPEASDKCDDPKYPFGLFQRVITENVEAMQIVNGLPKLEIN